MNTIAQRPIVRPEYTDPRGKTISDWAIENSGKLYGYYERLSEGLQECVTWATFLQVQYETELLRREMQQFDRIERENERIARNRERRQARDGVEGM